MNVELQRQLLANKRLMKKPRKPVVSDGASLVVTVHCAFKAKSVLISHVTLRDRTLQHHQGKPHKLPHASHYAMAHQRRSVEITDDVIIVDRHGRRVPPPSYATLRIDQLPEFKKG